MAKSKYLTAKQLNILPEERKALIAFVEAPALGRIIEVNGHAHYYDQSTADDATEAEYNECGTAGCVAGFVFAHATTVQGCKKLRGCKTATDYMSSAGTEDENSIFEELYGRIGRDWKLAEARKVVSKLLKTGEVVWPIQSRAD